MSDQTDRPMSELVPQTEGQLSKNVAFEVLSQVPTEAEWFANIDNPRTRRSYQTDLGDFLSMDFINIKRPEDFRVITRAHVIAWRNHLVDRSQSPATIRRKLSALSSLFEYLCENNAVTHNPVKGVKRPKEKNYEGKTPALSNDQARRLLDAPPEDTLKGKRDRAILATLLYHGLRREELCGLRVKDVHMRGGTPHFQVHGKGGKIRYLPVHPEAARLIEEYLDVAGHRHDGDGSLFRPVKNNYDGDLSKPLATASIYESVVMYYAKEIGIDPRGICPHALRATAATNALVHGADIARVQQWLGHAKADTTRLYDKRKNRAEDSPTFKVAY